VALIATMRAIGAASWIAAFDPLGLVLLPFCPGGLMSVLGLNPQGQGIFGMIICGWLVYIGLVLAGLKVRQRPLFYLLYGALVIVLVCNVVGCRKMNVSLSGIH